MTPAIQIRSLRVVRGETEVLPDLALEVGARQRDRPARPQRLWQVDAHARHRRRPDRRRRRRRRCSASRPAPPACATASAYVTQAPSRLPRPDRARERAATSRACSDVEEAPRSTRRSRPSGWRSYAERVTAKLSGGQRARVSLATALLGSPEVLVLDEPTVGLDPVLRRDLWALFRELARRRCDAARVEPRDGRGRALRRSSCSCATGSIIASETPASAAPRHRPARRRERVPHARSRGGGMSARVTRATAARVLAPAAARPAAPSRC